MLSEQHEKTLIHRDWNLAPIFRASSFSLLLQMVIWEAHNFTRRAKYVDYPHFG